MTPPLFRLLLLGGTSDASALARILDGYPGLHVISSLAGRTTERRLPPGDVRIGGFGGIEGLTGYLRAQAIDAVIDATHPFAARIARNAASACAHCDLPRLKLVRPPWHAVPGDLWHPVPSISQAAQSLRDFRSLQDSRGCAFISTGRQGLADFYSLSAPRLVMRMIELPSPPPPPHVTVLLNRGPFTVNSESRLMKHHGVSALVTKNSGGTLTYAKIEAARAMGIPVILIDRPAIPFGDQASSAQDALLWVEGLLQARFSHTPATGP